MKPIPLPKLPKLPVLPIITIPGLRPAKKPEPEAGAEDPTIEEVVSELKTSFMERAKAEDKRVQLVTDSEFWCCFCFENRAQKDAFLKALGLWEAGDKYVNGVLAAKKLGVDLGNPVAWPGVRPSSKRLQKLVGQG